MTDRRHHRNSPGVVAAIGLVLVALIAGGLPVAGGGAAWLPGGQPATATAGSDTAGLRSVGGTAPEVARATSEQAWRSQAGALLAAEDSAWRGLSRAERRLLLDGEVRWGPYDDLTGDNPELAGAVFPIAYFAAEIRADDAIATDELSLNEVVLALPLGKLGPALEEGSPQAVIVGPDVVLLVDNVVVGLISAGADLGIAAESGAVDEFGRIVVDGAATVATMPAAATSPRTESAVQATSEPPLVSARGEAIGRVPLADLPVEAADTIALIEAGEPFPFDRDGVVFGNFEGQLPAAADGYYREYTVITPGLDHRGARRIVTGERGEVFYSDDHYESFLEVILPDD